MRGISEAVRDTPAQGTPWRVVAALIAIVGLYLGWRAFWFLTDDAFIAFRYVSNRWVGQRSCVLAQRPSIGIVRQGAVSGKGWPRADAERRKAFGRAGRARVEERFGLDQIIEQLEQHYRELLAG